MVQTFQWTLVLRSHYLVLHQSRFWILYSQSIINNLLKFFVHWLSSRGYFVIFLKVSDKLLHLMGFRICKHLIIQTVLCAVWFYVHHFLIRKVVNVYVYISLNVVVYFVLVGYIHVNRRLLGFIVKVTKVFIIFERDFELKTYNNFNTFYNLCLLRIKLFKMHYKRIGFQTWLYNPMHHIWEF